MTLPEVPPTPDTRTQYFLQQLRLFVLNLDKRTGGTTQVDTGGGLDAFPFVPGSLTMVAPVSVDADTVTKSWTTYDASATIPDGASYGYLWVHGEIGSSGDQLSIDVRSDSGESTYNVVKTIAAQSNVDTVSESVTIFVPLSTSRGFDYEVTGTLNTDAAWQIKLIGYL